MLTRPGARRACHVCAGDAARPAQFRPACRVAGPRAVNGRQCRNMVVIVIMSRVGQLFHRRERNHASCVCLRSSFTFKYISSVCDAMTNKKLDDEVNVINSKLTQISHFFHSQSFLLLILACAFANRLPILGVRENGMACSVMSEVTSDEAALRAAASEALSSLMGCAPSSEGSSPISSASIAKVPSSTLISSAKAKGPYTIPTHPRGSSHGFSDEMLSLPLRDFKTAIANLTEEERIHARHCRRNLQNRNASGSLRKRIRNKLQNAVNVEETVKVTEEKMFQIVSECAMRHFQPFPDLLATFLEDVGSNLKAPPPAPI